jgi:hypoxanthine-DNA glycosylase
MTILTHPFAPIFDKKSKILILGSFPSNTSREQNFYYAHPRNRFWKIIAHLTKTENFPDSVDEKKQMLLENKIALWDIVKSCNIEGSEDNRIRNPTPVDLFFLLENAPIKHIFTNGRKTYQLFYYFFAKHLAIDVKVLPSTSPANAACNFTKLAKQWRIILHSGNN